MIIRTIDRKDYGKAIGFAIKGMHFDWYMDSRLLLKAYGRYFWYLEMNRTTHILAAYEGDALLGVLLAEVYGEKRQHRSLLQRLYVALAESVQKLFFKGGAGLYEDTVQAQLLHYKTHHVPDGEIIFLAADPDAPVRGIGTALLHALEKDVSGKTLFLHTDDACTFAFYEHRGFTRMEDHAIVLHLPKGEVPLRCFLYERQF